MGQCIKAMLLPMVFALKAQLLQLGVAKWEISGINNLTITVGGTVYIVVYALLTIAIIRYVIIGCQIDRVIDRTRTGKHRPLQFVTHEGLTTAITDHWS